ncbi:glucan endo-1,3-beta-glucosidase 9 [Dendrobium catenatum]|uniref:Glucan endo-1,3-beta-glucosidase 9 n=1 Tax=Dendrobium catenatum TaxID=906689 RepID=A0A2I0VM93_9ASPA|nr:glucan endo-1,3-beta-glucosidase 9 [Dendrobium catenatum]PKU64534.1 Glucan endo-1,3-beta-glucosidase 9 [Dendrobium catenatum]
MWSVHRQVIVLFLLLARVLTPAGSWRATAVGVNWGTSSSHPLPSAMVVSGLLQSNNITSVKLFDADPSVLESLSGSRINVVVGIPNNMLSALNSSKKAAASWVHDNITRYLPNGGVEGGVRIEYIAVGDEPFLLSYAQQFYPFIVGAAINIHLALVNAKLADKVKIIVPCSSDVYQSNFSLPSTAHFRDDLNTTMFQLLSFLSIHRSPFVIDINPFLSFQQNKNLSIDYFLFQSSAHHLSDGHNRYKNFLDSSIDALVTSLTKAGFRDMEIMIGRIGWPTDGSANATAGVAQSFMQALVEHLKNKVGTPLRPKRPVVETYIFSLLDEDQRDITTGNYERHLGIFTFDGQAKYIVDLGQGSKKLANAQNVEYLSSRWCVVNNNKDLSNASASAVNACTNADCTALSSGGSCFKLGWPANISYAFNSYYQQHDQGAESCDFDGLGLLTTVDPSIDDCMFAIALRTSFSTSLRGLPMLFWCTIVSSFLLFDLVKENFILDAVF